MSKHEYEVGYGKPPKSGRYKAGQSGNPKGRPKGRKSMNTIIDDVFRKKISLREGGRTKKVSQIEALFRRILNDSLKGNAKAADQALELLQMLSGLSERVPGNEDDSFPDQAADIEALETLLKLHDLPTNTLTDGGTDDE